MSEQYPVALAGIEYTEVDDDGMAVILPGDEEVHYLNNSGIFMLELCNGKYSKTEIIEAVQVSFNLDDAPVKDVDDFLSLALGSGLITIE